MVPNTGVGTSQASKAPCGTGEDAHPAHQEIALHSEGHVFVWKELAGKLDLQNIEVQNDIRPKP